MRGALIRKPNPYSAFPYTMDENGFDCWLQSSDDLDELVGLGETHENGYCTMSNADMERSLREYIRSLEEMEEPDVS